MVNSVPECKVWKNPMSLLRGAEYSRLTALNGKEPLTFYDMNLSAQDHQTFFTCESDEGKCDYEIMQRAWRERQPATRISLAKDAMLKNAECTPALILLAEEEAQTIVEAEKLFKQVIYSIYSLIYNIYNILLYILIHIYIYNILVLIFLRRLCVTPKWLTRSRCRRKSKAIVKRVYTSGIRMY